jgi:glyoxalase-like protein
MTIMRTKLVLFPLFVVSLLLPNFSFAAQPPLEVDHVWITVSQHAPERELLEDSGFSVSPVVNNHLGQGTSSVTVEFQNAYLELIWVEPTTPVAPGAERALEKFKSRSQWRSTGWCPIGIGFRRTSADFKFPFSTWAVSPEWLPKGSAIEILTARDDTKSPSLFVTPQELAVNPKNDAAHARGPAMSFIHKLGVKRVTGVRLVNPADYKPVESLEYLRNAGLIGVTTGKEWTVELTFDGGKKGKSKDLRPKLPLIVKY